MYSTACTRFSKVSGVSGLVISLALVAAGNPVFAEGVTAVGGSASVSTGVLGDFSATDLESLEHASTAQATASRLVALGVKSAATKKARAGAGDAAVSATFTDGDLFPHSARVLPMMVARPQAETFVARTAIGPRPGLAQPVGVSWASMRPHTSAR